MENFALQVAFLLLPSLPFLLFMKMQALLWASQVALEAKNLPTNAGDTKDCSLIPGSERFPGVGNGNLLQYSCLENSMDRGAWQATVHVATKSWT